MLIHEILKALSELIAASEQRMREYIDTAIAASEQRTNKRIEASEQRTNKRIEASEQRTNKRIDTAIAASEQRTNKRIDTAIAASEKRTNKRIAASEHDMKEYIAAAIEVSEERMTGKFNAVVESYVTPQVQKLADGHLMLAEKMNRVEQNLNETRDDVAIGKGEFVAQGYINAQLRDAINLLVEEKMRCMEPVAPEPDLPEL